VEGKYEEIEVLITVKTSPEPSERYFDTVCVAGVRIDGDRHDWVRLFPIQFRHLEKDDQFRKYEVLRLLVRPPHNDLRRESRSPDQGRITRVRSLAGWAEKAAIVDEVLRTTTCDLQAAARAEVNAPSLGLIAVTDLGRLLFEVHPGWTPAQQTKLEAAYFLPDQDLFGEKTHPPPRLKPPRFKVRYQYRCESTHCRGHIGQMLDWELTALQARFATDDAIKDAVVRNFHDLPSSTDRTLSFYVGNFFDLKKRAVFSVLGAYYPRRADVNRARASKDTLF
jgi:hypothetical protein